MLSGAKFPITYRQSANLAKCMKIEDENDKTLKNSQKLSETDKKSATKELRLQKSWKITSFPPTKLEI